jgi:hypothetical protein
MLAGASIRAPHATVPILERAERGWGWTMIWRPRIRQWLGAAIVGALAGGLAVKHAERADGASPGAALGEAMSEAVHQRQLIP